MENKKKCGRCGSILDEGERYICDNCTRCERCGKKDELILQEEERKIECLECIIKEGKYCRKCQMITGLREIEEGYNLCIKCCRCDKCGKKDRALCYKEYEDHTIEIECSDCYIRAILKEDIKKTN